MISGNWANRILFQNLLCKKEPRKFFDSRGYVCESVTDSVRAAKELAPGHRAVFVTTNTRYVIHIAQTKMLRLTTVKSMGIVGPTEFKRNEVSDGRVHTGDAKH
jgi:hypothetical protein